MQDHFFAYSWSVDKKETEITIMRIYGLTKDNENICVIVEDFLPYIYLELPDNIQWITDLKSKAPTLATTQLCSRINEIMRAQKPIKIEIQYKKRLYYATLKNGKKRLYPYLKCYFSNTNDARILSYKIRADIFLQSVGRIKLKMHENNASPVLQLTSVKKLPVAGWISFQGKKIESSSQVTHCKYEYTASWKKLNPVNSDTLAKPLIMGFDIEVNSSLITTMPSSSRPADKIFQISCVFIRQGERNNSVEDAFEKYLLTLGEPDFELLPDINVHCYETEYDLLVGFRDLIMEKQPNVVIGYNIFCFDIPYIIDRVQKSPCCSEFLEQSMLKDQKCEIQTIKWSSSAYKNQAFNFLDVEGRIFIDLLPVVKRDYKMNNYKLKTISAYFLKGQTKDPLDAPGIFRCYRLGMKGGRKGEKALSICGKYCVQDSVLVVKLFEVLRTWVGYCEMAKVTNVQIFALFTQGQQLRVFSQVYKKCTHENIVVERDVYHVGPDDYYVGAIVFPPNPGLYEKVVPFDFASLYPSSIIAYNLCWSTAVKDESISDEKCHIMEWEDHIGCEHDPKEIRKKELIKILSNYDAKTKKIRMERDTDKKNMGRFFNVKVYNERIQKIKKQCEQYREEKSAINKTKHKHIICCKRRYRWLKEPLGVLPSILKDLLDSRSLTKKELKTNIKMLYDTKEETEKERLETLIEVLDKRQLALKVSSNSGYGATGARKGYLTFMPVAMCTTFMGRQSIEKARMNIEERGGKFVYGDTDSNYVTFPKCNTAQKCWDYSEKVAKQVSALYPPPMSLAFEEKIYWKFLILTKKKYMSQTCKRDGILEKDISKKGVLLSRRDNSNFVRNVYSNVTMMIFEEKKMHEILNYIVEEINKLCSHFYPYSDFVITKSVGDIGKEKIPRKIQNEETGEIEYKMGDYKVKMLPSIKKARDQKLALKNCGKCSCDGDLENLCSECTKFCLKCLPAQVQLAEKMRKRGQLVFPGTRLEYVITDIHNSKAKQYEKIESIEYFEKHSRTLEIDYMAYLKLLTNPMDQLLNIVYLKEKNFTKNFVLSQYTYRLKYRHKIIKEICALNSFVTFA